MHQRHCIVRLLITSTIPPFADSNFQYAPSEDRPIPRRVECSSYRRRRRPTARRHTVQFPPSPSAASRERHGGRRLSQPPGEAPHRLATEAPQPPPLPARTARRHATPPPPTLQAPAMDSLAKPLFSGHQLGEAALRLRQLCVRKRDFLFEELKVTKAQYFADPCPSAM